jgi:hypothetical protein
VRGAFDSPKNHRGRSVPMADRLAGELERHFQASRRREENHLVFAHPVTGHVQNASKPSRQFYVALERASVHHVTFRGLRHTLGTQMATLGAPMRAIQEWMGDANITDDRGLLALRAGPDRRCRVRAEGVRGCDGGAAGEARLPGALIRAASGAAARRVGDPCLADTNVIAKAAFRSRRMTSPADSCAAVWTTVGSARAVRYATFRYA